MNYAECMGPWASYIEELLDSGSANYLMTIPDVVSQVSVRLIRIDQVHALVFGDV